MKTAIPYLFLVLLIAQTALAQSEKLPIPKKHTTEEKLRYFLSLSDSLRTMTQTPGIGMALVYNNEIIYKGGLGYRDKEAKLPVTPNTLFAIGSTSKSFTGVLAAKSVEKGLLSWTDPIQKYYPELELKEDYVARHVNFLDAFTHFSGLGRHDSIWKGKNITQEQLLAKLKDLDFHGGFRQRWDYNNLMYAVIGKALENIHQKTWHQQIKEAIFTPLGMKSSYSTYADFMAHPEKSIGYAQDGNRTPHINVDMVAPSGSISSTPTDIAQYLQLFVNKGIHEGRALLTPESFEFLTTPHESMSYQAPNTVRFYSIGWGGTITGGKKNLGHAGAIDGQNALVNIQPEDGFGIFIMTNQVSDIKYLLAQYAKQIFLSEDYSRDIQKEKALAAIPQVYQFGQLLITGKEKEALKLYETMPKEGIESLMNGLGYGFLAQQDLKNALLVFQLNAEHHPASFNAFDSLAEGYFKNEQYGLALTNYKKSLELNPKNANATAMIQKIRGLQ